MYYILVGTATAVAAAKSLQSCPTLCDPIDSSSPGSPVPGILQARTGVGCHFLLQCMKVKSESEVAQSCPTLSDPMDCSLPGSSVHGNEISRAAHKQLISLASHTIIFNFICVMLCRFFMVDSCSYYIIICVIL